MCLQSLTFRSKNWDTCESRGVIWVNLRLSMLINLFFTKITVNELC
jgi:hypothetical protein